MLIELECRDARRMDDPVTGGDRHFFRVNVLDIPEGIPTEPNPRDQDTDRAIYRRIKKSLVNDDDGGGAKNAFYVKNKGITMLVTSVRKVGPADAHRYLLEFEGEANGIVDGAHTYNLIRESQDYIRKFNEDANGDKIEQYVEVRVLTGSRLPSLVTDIAGGLNTGVQVQPASLANLAHHFEWLKAAIKDAPYRDKIAFRQFEDREYSVTDILCFLDVFNVIDFPNDKERFPTRAYDSANSLLRAYIAAAEERAKNPNGPPHQWERAKPLVRDILELHDIISSTGVDLYNAPGSKRGGALSWVKGNTQRKTKDGRTSVKERTYDFIFLGTTGKKELYRGALMPMLGAFRCLVEEDPRTGDYRWKVPFADVKAIWSELGGVLMERTQQTSEDLGRKPDAIGKSHNHWSVLYSTVTRHFLLKKMEKMERQLARK